MIYPKIKELRQDKDLTQQQLADYLHVSRSAYRNYENGERAIPIEILSELADYYNTSIEFLIGKKDK